MYFKFNLYPESLNIDLKMTDPQGKLFNQIFSYTGQTALKSTLGT
jgi:hypothetical protein